jgi:hypothetical protein|tara:strand:+ start:1104 stop:1331 length:228 start_codon:yes stop_codon:yes gene_type:complete
MDTPLIIDTLLGIVIVGTGYFLVNLSSEVKRIDILLNRTREDFATKAELREDMDRVMEALHRVEDKLDRALTQRS